MISIYVWGTPNGAEEDLYRTLTTTLTHVFEAKELEPIVVFFPPDRMRWELGKEMVVQIFSGRIIPTSERWDIAKSVGMAVCQAFHPERLDCIVLDEAKYVADNKQTLLFWSYP